MDSRLEVGGRRVDSSCEEGVGKRMMGGGYAYQVTERFVLEIVVEEHIQRLPLQDQPRGRRRTQGQPLLSRPRITQRSLVHLMRDVPQLDRSIPSNRGHAFRHLDARVDKVVRGEQRGPGVQIEGTDITQHRVRGFFHDAQDVGFGEELPQ